MVDTFRLMNQIRLEKYNGLSNEDLARIFKETNDQSIIAEIFCKNFKLIMSTVYEVRYRVIEKQDKTDAAVQGVYNALRKYDSDKGYVFNTFLIKNIRCQLANYISYLTQKRHDAEIYSLDAMRENTDNEDYDVNISKSPINEYDNIELRYDLINTDLTDRERVMCKAIMNNPDITDCELAEILKCHRHTVRKEKQNLQVKLAYLL